MSILTDLVERLRALLRRDREDLELAEELRFHFEMEVEENLRRGLSPAEARRQAALRLGGMTQVLEATRDARGVRWLDDMAQDVRYGLRGIRRNPLFAAALIITLGLGIGASAAMFSVVDALLLRPLPYGEPERLVEVWWSDPWFGTARNYTGRGVARTWAEHAAPLFDGMLLHIAESVTYTEGEEPMTLMVEAVSPSFAEVLRVRPALGRAFEESDALPGAEPVAVLSHAFWRSAFGGDPQAVGRTIELNGIRHRIVGVMPAGFKFPTDGTRELWVPLRADGTALGRMPSALYHKARLPATERLEAVQAWVDALAAWLDEQRPLEGGWSIRLAPLQESRGGGDDVRRPVWFMAGTVALILLVAAINAVNLLLVRAWRRTHELAVRSALGASRRRLLRQLLTESLLLALASAVVAVLLAHVILRSMLGIMPDSIAFWAPHAIEVQHRTLAGAGAAAGVAGAPSLSGLIRGFLYGVAPNDPLTIGAVAVVCIGAALAASWWPARRTIRIDPADVLRSV